LGTAGIVVAILVGALIPVAAGPAVAAGTFTDDDGSPHESNIEFIAARDITSGCSQQNPSLYCPNQVVTRGQMATFISRALHLPATGTDFFADDNGNTHEDNINRLAAAGITAGCSAQNPNLFCPNQGVSRAEMATFISRAWQVPASGVDFFTDDNGSTHESNINNIRAVNITGGCSAQNPSLFCPIQKVNRGQMASFLARAIQWDEGGATTTTTPPPGCSITQPVTNGPLPIVTLPFALTFSGSEGGVCDAGSDATGFSYVWAKAAGNPYLRPNLDVTGGELRITTTAGLAATTSNNQDNSMGVGVDPGQSFIASTVLVNPTGGTGNEQAGIWFGTHRFNQTDYAKLIVLFRPSGGPAVQLLVEENDAQLGASPTVAISNPSSSMLELEMTANAADLTVSGRFRINGGAWTTLGPLNVPVSLFTQDQAGVDGALGTDSFLGVYGSHRTGSQRTYRFASFNLQGFDPEPPPGGDVAFAAALPTEITYKPTSMTVGPDGRLYVLDATGPIRAYTVNANGSLTLNNTYSVLPAPPEGIWTALGLAFDPSSTAQNMTVWISHSITTGPDFSLGVANSSRVTRVTNLTGASPQATQMISGLPRAIANHAINSIHFDPDDPTWLYIAIAGQTGAGGPNDANTEFGSRPEQPLSSALLKAQVRSGTWSPANNGNCASSVSDGNGTASKTVPATCSVQLVATGLRNMYDFVFASDGFIYGNDNALGVAGTVPKTAAPDCQGIVHWTNPNQAGSFDPDEQPDRLQRIDPNPTVSYYGHPNPARDQCVFFDGNFQESLFGGTINPPSNYQPTIKTMNAPGSNQARSFNSVIQYESNAFGSTLQGKLIFTAFGGAMSNQGLHYINPSNPSAGPNRITVTRGATNYGFNQPLPLVELPDGRLVVGEFRGRTSPSARILVLTPNP
jgi:hypothetical protein